MANKRGKAQLNSTIMLSNVLHVPDLNCSLVSIVKLINELFCTVIFTHNYCMIEDHTVQRPIGVGEQKRGAYFFKENQSGAMTINKVVTHDL